MFDYSKVKYDPVTGDGKGFKSTLEGVKQAVKDQPIRPLDDVLGTKLVVVGAGLRAAVVTVTPEMALELLATRNQHNREISFSHVRRLSGSMASGRWRLTHQGGAFDRDENIADIQHRLSACWTSGVSIQMLIVVGLDSDLFKYIDSGKARSIAATLGLAGYNGVSAIVGSIVKNLAVPYEEGDIAFFDMEKRYVSPDEVVEFVEDHQSLVDAAHTVIEIHEAAIDAIGDKGVAVFAYWRIMEAWGQTVADDFLEMFGDSSNLSEKHGITVGVARIEKHKSGKLAGKLDPKRKAILKPHQILWIVAAAFKAWRANQKVTRLDPRADDAFPRFEDSTAPALPAAVEAVK